MEDDDIDPWPTLEEQAEYTEDMRRRADNPQPPPTPEEVEAMVEEWLKYHEARVRVVDEYHAAVRSRTGTAPPF